MHFKRLHSILGVRPRAPQRPTMYLQGLLVNTPTFQVGPERALINHNLFCEAPLDPRMRIKNDHAMLSIVFVLFCATVSQTALTNSPKLAPHTNMKSTSFVLSHVLFVELVIHMEQKNSNELLSCCGHLLGISC